MSDATRKPDYRVGKGPVGAGWVNDDQTISIVLNDFVVLSQDGNLLITLFPTDHRP